VHGDAQEAKRFQAAISNAKQFAPILVEELRRAGVHIQQNQLSLGNTGIKTITLPPPEAGPEGEQPGGQDKASGNNVTESGVGTAAAVLLSVFGAMGVVALAGVAKRRMDHMNYEEIKSTEDGDAEDGDEEAGNVSEDEGFGSESTRTTTKSIFKSEESNALVTNKEGISRKGQFEI
jgi:hypothetical protein